jgi:FkbM family methyltransferase
MSLKAEPSRLHTVNSRLKIITKFVVQREDVVLFLKAVKIAADVSLNKTYDPIIPLLGSIVATPTPTIFDIGANMGQFAARLSRHFPCGQIYSFEPLHANAVGLRRMKRWLHLANVTILEEALCDRIGVEAMHVPVFGGGYRDGALAVLEGSKRPYDNVTYHVETVRTNTIDAFAAARAIDRVDFVKIDTEGAEERVVRGGLGLISGSLSALYIEAPHDRPWLSVLYDIGYRPFYTDGATLYPPREGEQQTNVLVVHESKIASGAVWYLP